MNRNKIEECKLSFINRIVDISTHYASDKTYSIAFRAATHDFHEKLKEIIDWNNLTYPDMAFLGFKHHELQDHTEIMLIPLYLKPIVPIGLELFNIFGEKIVNDGHNISDNTHDFLIYGIKIDKLMKRNDE